MTRFRRIVFRRAPGFVLEHRMSVSTSVSGYDAALPHVHLHKCSILTLGAGYEWDGPSGPTLKTMSSMRASAIHDALYRLISEGKIPPSCRSAADYDLRRYMIKDGASWLRAWYFWAAVRLFGWLYIGRKDG